MVRKIDELGRIVIPKEMRDMLAINVGDGLECFVKENENQIVYRKYTSHCFVCDSIHGVKQVNKAHLCEKCREKLLNEEPVSA